MGKLANWPSHSYFFLQEAGEHQGDQEEEDYQENEHDEELLDDDDDPLHWSPGLRIHHLVRVDTVAKCVLLGCLLV